MGMRHADFSSQAGNDDAEDQGCDPSELDLSWFGAAPLTT